MNLFESRIDRKFKRIGFNKTEENQYGASYERERKNPDYTQRLDLIHKSNGKHLIQSYDPLLTDDKKIGNTCVGLTMYEAKLCIEKMKKMGWKIKK